MLKFIKNQKLKKKTIKLEKFEIIKIKNMKIIFKNRII